MPDADGGWRLSGLKMFSLKGHLTDIGLCAARTGPPESRYQGITLFLVDLHAPGVRRSVVASIADEQFSRVELDDVRVPAGDRLGEVNNGWPLVTQALTVERTGLDYYLKADRWLTAACEVLDAAAGPHGVDDAVLEEIGRHGAAVNAGRLLAWRVLAGLAEGEVDELAAATAKLYTSELAQRIAGWSTARLAGSIGDPRLPAEAARLVEASFREAPGLTISAGTSEMMLQIVASLALDRLEQGADVVNLAEDPVAERLRTVVRGRLRAAAASRPAAGPRTFEQADDSARLAWSVLCELGVPAMDAPAEAGGLALGLAASAAVAEELGRAGLAVPYLAGAFAADVAAAGADDADQPLVRDLVDGRLAVALAGFELPVPPVEATADAGGTLWLTGRLALDRPVDELAKAVLLPVRLPDEHTGLVVLDLAGLDLRPGRDPSGAAALGVLDHVRCPAGRLLISQPDPAGCPGGAVGRARIRQAGYLLGLAQAALQAGVRYATERRQFDRTLREFQSVAFRLAAAAVEVEALRLTVAHAVWLADGDEPFGGPAAAALAQAAETSAAVTRMVVQVCGARGMTSHLPVQRYYLLGRREASRLGRPGRLWREAARERLATPGRTVHADPAHSLTQTPAAAN